MVKSKLSAVLLSALFIGAVSCAKDDDDDTGNDGPDQPQAEPMTLECGDIDSLTVLEDRGAGTDYIVPCFIYVKAGLVIEPGVTIAFEQDAGFEIMGYGNAEGYIEAVGTEEDSVVFTGDIQTPGAWRHILIDSDDLRNTMDFCVIEYAGHTDGEESALELESSTKLVLTNSTFRHNNSYGLFVRSTSNIEGYANNRFTGNDNYPMHIAAHRVRHLDGMQSEYEGNTHDEIYVFSNSIYDRGFLEGQDIHEWTDPGVPFFVDEDILVGEREFGHLRITEGCQLRFGEEFAIRIDENNAILEILGEPQNKVTLSGRNGQGSWVGIFLNTNSTQNKIENAIITDGGQSTAGHWFDNPANLSLGYHGDEVNLTLTNVELNNSGGCGISEEGTIHLTTNNVSFNGNVGGDFCE